MYVSEETKEGFWVFQCWAWAQTLLWKLVSFFQFSLFSFTQPIHFELLCPPCACTDRSGCNFITRTVPPASSAGFSSTSETHNMLKRRIRTFFILFWNSSDSHCFMLLSWMLWHLLPVCFLSLFIYPLVFFFFFCMLFSLASSVCQWLCQRTGIQTHTDNGQKATSVTKESAVAFWSRGAWQSMGAKMAVSITQTGGGCRRIAPSIGPSRSAEHLIVVINTRRWDGSLKREGSRPE